MNQQRSRRFRASKETGEKIEMMASIKQDLMARGCQVPPEKSKGDHFDSNCITPVRRGSMSIVKEFREQKKIRKFFKISLQSHRVLF